MNGLNMYDYGARWRGGEVPPWPTMDPLCELYYNISPYAYCHNNPIIFIDPDGRGVNDVNQLDEVVVTGERPKDSYSSISLASLFNTFNRETESTSMINPMQSINLLPKTIAPIPSSPIENKKSSKDDALEAALAAIGITADNATIFVKNNGGKQIVYVTLKGTTAAANATKVISALKGISNATIIVGIAADFVHVAIDPDYAGKAMVNTGVTVVATIIGATVCFSAGVIIGGGYLLLDQLGAFDRPTNIPYYDRPVCPQDNTRVNVPYK